MTTEVDVPMVQGSDWMVRFQYLSLAEDGTETPIDITGKRVTLALSKGANVSPPLVSLDTDEADPEITIDGASGDVQIVVPATTTAGLPFNGRDHRWRYECKLHLSATSAVTLGIGDVPATATVPLS